MNLLPSRYLIYTRLQKSRFSQPAFFAYEFQMSSKIKATKKMKKINAKIFTIQ
nr:MAG TPA_asm: hypothetical protein [Caudoviricetes sp.]